MEYSFEDKEKLYRKRIDIIKFLGGEDKIWIRYRMIGYFFGERCKFIDLRIGMIFK